MLPIETRRTSIGKNDIQDNNKKNVCMTNTIDTRFGGEILDNMVGEQKYKEAMNTELAILCMLPVRLAKFQRAETQQHALKLDKNVNEMSAGSPHYFPRQTLQQTWEFI
ncbi:hypothetical protein A3Q56_06590 [Intoshia linei]|uniref:Uncharacterized protein n=1 Tax=Intoshia linei TaxID=1819745 RepID=A0A177AUN3_9BILA|nr:hypothetical protein A3Q56_06590 [Intoshia linei]